MIRPLSLGLDIGSTTVKAVVVRDETIIFSDYRRHNADVRGEVQRLLSEIGREFDEPMAIAVTGSGGLSVAGLMGVPFVQEVIAGTEAIEHFHPETDVVIELGGEDAKITYLHPTPEQRMNGTCAGGTGAFIDQMASLLRTDAAGLNELASQYQQLYPIASRCGVFAKSDVQPLMNQGADHTDLAASVFQAVATQTIAGLACGRPIRGNVTFLGGPLHFLPELRKAYERALAGQVTKFTTPKNAQLYVAIGASMLANETPVHISDVLDRLAKTKSLQMATNTMRPLFKDQAERDEFNERHAKAKVDQVDISQASGPCFLGIDAGSTTIKAVLLNQRNEICYSYYDTNGGDPVGSAVMIVRDLFKVLPDTARLARTCVTGYGEDLVKAALHAEDGEIETMAHYRAAEHLSPGVNSVIDIGGQDMKYLRIKDGAVDSIAVNEACSSGCGSFLQTFAETMSMDVKTFAAKAVQAQNPVDLGSRCTVFMNSSVKQAQKEGASVGDISAGLSYSVVRNALYKVIKIRDANQLGENVVVQGGTFLNDAVLRAFELLTKREVVRPNIAGLMGAFGAALTAKSRWDGQTISEVNASRLEDFSVVSTTDICRHCQNHCRLTISTFNDGERLVTGNRCERGASLEKAPKKSDIPNLYDFKYKRLFSYRRLTEKAATRGDIGVPRVMNMYENYPFWFTVLTSLGFRVIISGRSNHDLFEKGMETIPAENICYPAKLAHGHIEYLLDKGVKTIWYPCINYETKHIDDADNNFNCPIVAFYPQVLARNIDRLREPGVKLLHPFLNLNNPEKLAERLVEVFEAWDVSLEEAKEAIAKGIAEDTKVKDDIRQEGLRALEYMDEHKIPGIVLAGRPYHVDPEINHGIPDLINGLGIAVLSEDAVVDLPKRKLQRPLRVMDQWAYHSRLYEAAGWVREQPNLKLVQLNSFGCGLDAVTTDQVQEILEEAGDIYTTLKIDEVSNLGAARIRLRSLQAAAIERQTSMEINTFEPEPKLPMPVFGKREKKKHTLFVPQMSPIHFRLAVPVLKWAGFDAVLLDRATKDDIECGLRYVNNDACYPAIMVIGQLINQFETGRADPNNSTVGITQTGGMCRATNYAGMLRKGLKDAGYPQVPVLAVSAQGIEQHPGFKITPRLALKIIQALCLGDLIQTVLLRTRPYELVPGSATEMYQKWNAIIGEYFEYGGYSHILRRRIGYHWLIEQIVHDFDQLPLKDIPRKPRVGIVGEILVKFHPDANNNLVDVLESEGCEAAMPGMLGFFLQSLYTAQWKYDNFGMNKKSVKWNKLGIWFLEQQIKPVNRALANCNGKFDLTPPIAETARRAETVISLGTQAGEGWLLTGEMIELIEHGAPNIVCAQPFACLPNHVVGRGMFKELRRLYPEANIVSIDYDPGASEANQLNRIKLMVATAQKRNNEVIWGTEHVGVDDFQPRLV